MTGASAAPEMSHQRRTGASCAGSERRAVLTPQGAARSPGGALSFRQALACPQQPWRMTRQCGRAWNDVRRAAQKPLRPRAPVCASPMAWRCTVNRRHEPEMLHLDSRGRRGNTPSRPETRLSSPTVTSRLLPRGLGGCTGTPRGGTRTHSLVEDFGSLGT